MSASDLNSLVIALTGLCSAVAALIGVINQARLKEVHSKVEELHKAVIDTDATLTRSEKTERPS
jgi:hypothetical protein